jgi:hypothetical protein
VAAKGRFFRYADKKIRKRLSVLCLTSPELIIF